MVLRTRFGPGLQVRFPLVGYGVHSTWRTSYLIGAGVPLRTAEPFLLHLPQGPVHRSRVYLLKAKLLLYALHKLKAVGVLVFEQDERHRDQPPPGPRLDYLFCCQAKSTLTSVVAHDKEHSTYVRLQDLESIGRRFRPELSVGLFLFTHLPRAEILGNCLSVLRNLMR